MNLHRNKNGSEQNIERGENTVPYSFEADGYKWQITPQTLLWLVVLY